MRNYIFFLLLFVLPCMHLHCTKDLQTNNNNDNYAISLRLTVQNELPTLSWDKAEQSAKFKSYILLRSGTPIPDGINPITYARVDLYKIATIADLNITTFADSSINFDVASYYRLYIDLGDRFLESSEAEYRQNNLGVLPGNSFPTIIFDETEHLLVNLDRDNKTLTLYNYLTNQVVQSIVLDSLGSYENKLQISMENGQKVLYMFNSDGWSSTTFRLVRFSLPDLQVLRKDYLPLSAYYGLIHDNHLICDFEDKIIFINLTNLETEKTYNFDVSWLSVFGGTTNTLINCSSRYFTQFSYDLSSDSLTLLNRVEVDIWQDNILRSPHISPDKQYAILVDDYVVRNQDLIEVYYPNFDVKGGCFSTDSKSVILGNTENNKFIIRKVPLTSTDEVVPNPISPIDVLSQVLVAMRAIDDHTLLIVLLDINKKKTFLKKFYIL